MIFGRTDLRIGGSRAKFDVEVDGEVRFALAPPKPHEIKEKLSSRSKNFVDFFFFCRKMKRQESSETRFRKVWQLCEPCSRGKRPFKVRCRLGGIREA